MSAPSYILIGCGARKLPHPAPARDLYTGSLFRAARGYAETSGLPWAILSGLHGLVLPGQVIEPYDQRFRGGPDERERLFRLLRDQLRALPWRGVIEVHAGRAYAELVQDLCFVAFGGQLRADVMFPGWVIGRRLAWYREQRERRAA